MFYIYISPIGAVACLMGACFSVSDYASGNSGKKTADNKVYNLFNAIIGGIAFFY